MSKTQVLGMYVCMGAIIMLGMSKLDTNLTFIIVMVMFITGGILLIL